MIEYAQKVLEVVDKGLCAGKGIPIPGEMCVEAAVCYAYGLPHSDNPPCVGSAVRVYKIRLNDRFEGTNLERAKLMRKLSVAQLGSVDIDQTRFAKILAEQTIRQILPPVLRKAGLNAEADRCEKEGTRETAAAARTAARAAAARAAADAAARAAARAAAAAAAADTAADAAADTANFADAFELSAKIALDALIELKSPGCKYLYLCGE